MHCISPRDVQVLPNASVVKNVDGLSVSPCPAVIPTHHIWVTRPSLSLIQSAQILIASCPSLSCRFPSCTSTATALHHTTTACPSPSPPLQSSGLAKRKEVVRGVTHTLINSTHLPSRFPASPTGAFVSARKPPRTAAPPQATARRGLHPDLCPECRHPVPAGRRPAGLTHHPCRDRQVGQAKRVGHAEVCA